MIVLKANANQKTSFVENPFKKDISGLVDEDGLMEK